MNRVTIATMLFVAASVAVPAQHSRIETTHENIRYWESPLRDRATEFSAQLQNGGASLSYDTRFGYLPAVLKRFDVPVESQILVFSKTSLQSAHISPDRPRAIYFNDDVAVAWVQGGPILEIAAHTPVNGMVFYTIGQSASGTPAFNREQVCMDCHHTASTLGVPGNLVRTTFPGISGLAVVGLAGGAADHRTLYEERWGGWYVTGRRGPARHRGNAVVVGVIGEGDVAASREAAPLQEKFQTSSYLSPYSDIVALTVFEHQVHMMNLITRVGWESRTGMAQQSTIEEIVDYMLFVDEAPLPSPIAGSSGFAELFSGKGPTDRRGRSLRTFDLNRRLFRYPCSYMIYSAAFQALPAPVKSAIYTRLSNVLSGKGDSARYKRLGDADRKVIHEILRDTLVDFPDS